VPMNVFGVRLGENLSSDSFCNGGIYAPWKLGNGGGAGGHGNLRVGPTG
jgi:hypothetical protein